MASNMESSLVKAQILARVRGREDFERMYALLAIKRDSHTLQTWSNDRFVDIPG
jgi:hypothetical protein